MSSEPDETQAATLDPYEQLHAAATAAIEYLQAGPECDALGPGLVVTKALRAALHACDEFRRHHVGGLGGQLELHRYAGRPVDPADAATAERAVEQYGDDDIQVEDPPYVSRSGDGAWVLAWLWVNNDDVAVD